MTSLLFAYVVFGPILHILIIHPLPPRSCLFAAVVTIDVFFKSFIIVSTYRRRHVASETVFKQDSLNPNPYSYSLTECTFSLNLDSYLNPDSFNRISPKLPCKSAFEHT